MKLGSRILFAFALLSASAGPALAQVTLGTPPFATFGGGPDQINLANLNVYLPIPIESKAGRGIPFAYNLGYNSSVWVPVNTGLTTTWSASPYFGFTVGNIGWQGGLTGGGVCYYGYCHVSAIYIDPTGTAHTFTCSGSCYGSNLIAPDGSGYILPYNGEYGDYVLDRSGNTFCFLGCGAVNPDNPYDYIEDTNGNWIGLSYNASNDDVVTDTLGQTVLTMPSSWTGSSASLTLPTGTATVYYETLSVRTNFQCSGVSEYGPTNTSLPYMIKLPDGTAYRFTYEQTPGYPSDVTGRVASVGLPSGGTISYTYTGANDGVNCGDGSTLGLSRTTPDGTWTYARSVSADTTTVTAPQLSYDSVANQTVYTFGSNGHETQRQIFQGSASGTPLRTIKTTWASNGTPATTITILEDGSTQSEVDTTYNSYGLLTSQTEYDWGSGGHGPQLKQKQYSYLSDTNTNYSSRNMMDLISESTIKDGSGNVRYVRDAGFDGFQIVTCPTGVSQHDDSHFGCSYNYRGNITSVTTYLTPASKSNPITKNFTFDVFGNQLTAQLNCCQMKTWAYSSTTNYTYPDSVTVGSGSQQLTTSYQYDLSTGALTTVTDPNNLTTRWGYTAYGYLSTVTRPDGSQISTFYDTSSESFNGQAYSVNTGVALFGPLTSQLTTFDAMGRPSAISELNGSTTVSAVSYQYDAIGRPWETSNPYTSAPSYWTGTHFDTLGRPTKIVFPDGQVTTYAYSLQTATITDPSGKAAKAQADALGRLVIAYEPDVNNGNSLTQETTYTYDVLDDLTGAAQGQQIRTYGYDALGRLTSVSTPEANNTATNFTYDNFDDVTSRTDPRGVVTNYFYDGLNRLIGVSYPTVPQGVSSMPNVCTTQGGAYQGNVCFYFDQGGAAAYALGKMTEMVDPSGSETTTFDNMGRNASVTKVIGGSTYATTYQYNQAGEITQVTYPSGRQVKPSYDAVGRPAALADTNTTYASGFSYDVAQHVNGFQYGNGVFASLGFSADRLQLTCLDYSTTNRKGACAHDATTLFGINYGYTQNGGDNGQITSITDSVDNGRSVTYTYDALARLASAGTVGSTNYPQWGLSWSYDRYGNRTAQTVTTGSGPSNCLVVSPTSNQITGTCGNGSGMSYDANGNMTNDGQNALSYDGENRLMSSSGSLGSATYVYDGNGVRVQKNTGGTATAYVFSGSKVIAEYVNGAAPSSPTREYIYSGGTMVAKIEGGATQYYYQDHLSVRFMTDSSGHIIGQQGHYPYGEQWYASNTTTKWAFTSYERDFESNNDYATAREYANRFGRFTALDPMGGGVPNPQSLNRYTYTTDDALNIMDPTGKDDSGLIQDPDICEIVDCGGGMPDYYADDVDLLPIVGVLKSTTSVCISCSLADELEFFIYQAPVPPNIPDTPEQFSTSCGFIVCSPPLPNPKKPCDVSASSLDNYLDKKHSPMAGQGSNLMTAGQKFNVDPRFVVALSGAESTFGNDITSGQFNAWNWFYNGPGKPAPFKSWSSGITSVSRGLGGPNYLGAPNGSITNTADVYKKYCKGSDCANALKNLNRFLKKGQGGDPNSLKFPCP